MICSDIVNRVINLVKPAKASKKNTARVFDFHPNSIYSKSMSDEGHLKALSLTPNATKITFEGDIQKFFSYPCNVKAFNMVLKGEAIIVPLYVKGRA